MMIQYLPALAALSSKCGRHLLAAIESHERQSEVKMSAGQRDHELLKGIRTRVDSHYH